jgi:DNA integrity scanning protein DisA with diadenylate cyclase activity
MGNVIDLFMWGYQRHIQISLQVGAELLFNQIDQRLKPTVCLLGILVDERRDRKLICLEPEDCGYSVKAFTEIKNLAQELEKVDEEIRILHSHPVAQENHQKRISNRAYVEAIQKILKREDLYGKTEKYVSYPTYIDGFLVFVILEIQKETLNKYYSLTKDKWNERYKISRSFIESAVDTFLKESANALKDPSNPMAIERSAEELLRESGRQFMYSISSAGGNIEGLNGLYDACNTISSLKYEGAEGLGKMVIAKNYHSNIRLTLQLNEPIKIRDFRKVRKFLELSNDRSVIICDSALIYGLGELTGKYNPKDESLFIINFFNHYKWELLHDNNTMMVVEYRQPNIPKDKIDRDKFYSDLSRIFNDIDRSQLDNLWDISIQATKQRHGTILVISDNASEEANRLSKQSLTLKPIRLTTDMIQQITSIDGAVLIDRSSICYAIGVILDGLATEKGDSSRGARYNSAIRYYEQFVENHKTVIVIISEDGIINLIPNLNPQIEHALVTEAIEKLGNLSEEKIQKRKPYNQLMNFFESVEFYLTEDECNRINELRNKIELNDNLEGMKIQRRDFKPNSEMNASYYVD